MGRSIVQIELAQVVDDPWLRAKALAIGAVPEGRGTPDLYILVRDGEAPLLRIDAYLDRGKEMDTFRCAIPWFERVAIGLGHRMHLVDPVALTVATDVLEGYFCTLYPTAERLLVASSERLYSYDASGTLRWSSPQVAIDGVVIDSCDDSAVVGRGEWDPPGGWRAFRLDVATGAAM